MWKDSGKPADSYYQIRSDCEDVPKSRFKIRAHRTLSKKKWQAAFTPEGHLDIVKTLHRIQRGGIHPSIRAEVWEFLLGCYDPNSTFEDREQIREHRRNQYSMWKKECNELFPIVGSGTFVTAPVITVDGQPVQNSVISSAENGHISDAIVASQSRINASGAEKVKDLHDKGQLDQKARQWMLTLHQIGLDVVRTDRMLTFYEEPKNLSKLWDILAVYSWIDVDVGYCQGMSDLCSPMIILLESEADAFWCFERLMRRLRGNFRCTERSVGVETQLGSLATITQVVIPRLHQHLDALGGGDYLFAFRMLLVLFRREFSFCDALYLWEMMWAIEYDSNLFLTYEEREQGEKRADDEHQARHKSIRQYGKFEREKMKNGAINSSFPLSFSTFLAASFLDKNSKLLQEAQNLDDVLRILNGMTGNVDAKKACSTAMKLHKKYLKKAKRAT